MTPPRYPLRATRRGSVLTAVVFAAALAVPLVNAVPASATPLVSAGDILVVDRDLSGTGKVIDVDPSTGAQSVLSQDGFFKDPFGAAQQADGQLVVADQDAVGGPGAIIRVNLQTGAQTVVSSKNTPGNMFIAPSDVAIAPDGNYYVVDPAAIDGQGAVFKVNATTGAQTVISQDQFFHNPRGIALDPNGNILVADEHTAGGGGGRVELVNPSTGVQTLICPQGDFSTPLGITTLNGQIIVGDENAYNNASGGIVKCDPTTGAESQITTLGSLHATSGVTIKNGQIIVASQDGFSGDGSYGDPDGGVLSVDPTTGVQTVISSGQFFNDPVEVVIANQDVQPPPPPVQCDGSNATIVGTSGNDTISGTSGIDIIAGLGGDDSITALGKDDIVCGGDGNDTIVGSAGNDTLDGGAGNDIVKGSAGNDTLIGGADTDKCIGGTGTDTASQCEIVKTVP